MVDDRSPVLLTGASGFVGSHVLHELLSRGYAVHALERRAGSLRETTHVREFIGSVLEPKTLAAAAAGCRSAIHLVGIIDEKQASYEAMHVQGTRNVLAAARHAGTVRRWVQMSALGTRPNAASRYHQTKWDAEELVRTSGIPYVILRPGLIHGPRGEFVTMLRNWSLGKASPYFFMPFIGSGIFGQRNRNRLQPIHVHNVAWLCAESLTNEAATDKTYDIAGEETLNWREFLRIASTHFRGKPRISIGIPAWYALLLASLPLPLPFNKDQIIMSQEDNIADIAPLRRDFPGLQLKNFAQTLEA